jgi:DNA repair protein RadC
MRPRIGGLDHEELWVLLLNTRSVVVGEIQLYVGTVSSCSIRVGEVFRAAVRRNSPAIAVAHNHPSGDPTPLPEDRAITQAMVSAGRLLDITLVDHVVIGRDTHASLRASGMPWE